MGESAWLNIGRVTGVHGLAGNLKIWSHAQSHETFARGRRVLLAEEGQTQGVFHTITGVAVRKKGMLLTLQDVTTREGAEALIGKDILMNREDLPEPEEDAWYWEDLMGLTVEDTQRGEIGTIDHLFPTGADDILVVKEGAREVLIPMNRHFVDEVNLEAGRVTVTLPEGMMPE